MGFLGKIRQSQKRNGKDWILALVSLLLAIGVWLVHNLGLNYIDFMTVPVIAECSIEGHSLASAAPVPVTVRCKATGYRYLESKHLVREGFRTVPVDRGSLHYAGGESYYMTSKDLQEYAYLIFGEKVLIEHFVTDTAFFRFPYEDSKKVAVDIPGLILCRSQYMVRKIKLDPDSVLVYGEPSRLAGIDYVATKPVKFTDLNSSVTGIAKIPDSKGIRYSDQTITYDVDVVRFVESKVTLPIVIRNLPEDRKLLIVPSEAELTIRSEFPIASDPLEGVSLYIDFKEFLKSRDGDCLVHVSGLGESVVDHSVSPDICQGVMGL